MNLPRWTIIKRLFSWTLLVPLTIAIYSTASPTIYESLFPHLYRFLPALVSLVVFIVATSGAALLVDTWRKEEKPLLESELYLVLVTLAIYVFMFLGFLNYALYALDHKAFTVDKPLEESNSARWRGEMQARLRLHHGNLEVLDALTTRLSGVSLGSFKKVMFSQQWFGWDKYRIAIPVAATMVELDYYLGSDRSRPETRLKVELDGKPVTISDAETLDVASALKALLEDKEWVRKEELMGVLRAEAQWERTKWIAPLERDLKRDVLMPLSLFLYQGAMDALGSSPKYFEPATALARAVAFCSALAKYLFFGLFLSLLSQRWATSSTDTAAVPRPSASGPQAEESGAPDLPLAAPRGMLPPPTPTDQHDRPGPAST